MIYNEDVDIYLPSNDVLRVSDGTWIQPQFVEVTEFENVQDYVGKKIVGFNSKTSGIVENIVRETYNDNAITVIYFSNLEPKGGFFSIGEKVVPEDKIGNFEFIQTAPLVLGSIDTLDILDGGRDYKLNDIIKVVQRDPFTLQTKTYGRESYLKVLGLTSGEGQLRFDLVDGGFGFTQDSKTFVYRTDQSGVGASFDVGTLTNTKEITYNTDIVNDYLEKSLQAISFNFPKLPSANLSSTLGQSLSYADTTVGTIGSLANVRTGKAYVNSPDIFVRSVTVSSPLLAEVSYSTTSNTVTFSDLEQILDYADTLLDATVYNFPRNPLANVASTLETTISINSFYNVLNVNDVIILQANSTDLTTREFHIVKNIVDLKTVELYTSPVYNSTVSAKVYIASTILPANFVPSDPIMASPNELVNGLNEKIRAFALTGKSIVANVVALTGKGFGENELVQAGLYGTVDTNIEIVDQGTGYTNNDLLVFTSPQFNRHANGYVVTDSQGAIVDAIINDVGSGYIVPPEIVIKTKTGSGGKLQCFISDFNYDTLITGRVKKKGNGKEFGYFTTTRGFLNSNKYIQDSYYYQDYSYEINVPRVLSKYKDILYETFHVSGTELFGKFFLTIEEQASSEILFENDSATITQD